MDTERSTSARFPIQTDPKDIPPMGENTCRTESLKLEPDWINLASVTPTRIKWLTDPILPQLRNGGIVIQKWGFDVKQFNISVSKHEAFSEAVEIRSQLTAALQLVDRLVDEPTANPDLRITEALVRGLIKARRSRDRHFDSELFADPAWDILLELYAAELGQRRVSVTSLCIGAAVPATTALRWIKALEKKGMIRRRPDSMDARRVFVSLSPETIESMEQFFRNVPTGMLLS